jgi:malonyl-CoA/methylmalonyl-CoA synthetase
VLTHGSSGSGILPVEAHYLLSRAHTRLICAGRDCMDKAGEIVAYMNKHGNPEFFALRTSCDAEPLESMNGISIDDTLRLALDDPGVVLFTSGTTGRPKMVVLPRRCFAYTELAEPGSATINYRPIHWIGGVRCLVEAMLTGVKLFTMEEKSTSISILKTLKNHKITSMSFSPMTLRRLKSVLTSKMEEDPQVDYASWFSGLSVIKCGGSMVDSSTMEFWSNLTGLPVEIFYSATELGGPAIKGIPTMPVSSDHRLIDEIVESNCFGRTRLGPPCQTLR